MDLRARKADGWTTVSFLNKMETVTVATGKTAGDLSFTLIGTRGGMPNENGQDVLDVDMDDERKLSSDVQQTDDGMSLPLDQFRPGQM